MANSGAWFVYIIFYTWLYSAHHSPLLAYTYYTYLCLLDSPRSTLRQSINFTCFGSSLHPIRYIYIFISQVQNLHLKVLLVVDELKCWSQVPVSGDDLFWRRWRDDARRFQSDICKWLWRSPEDLRQTRPEHGHTGRTWHDAAPTRRIQG